MTSSTGPANRTFTNPVIDDDFPDPDVLQVGQTFYAYATVKVGVANIQAARSRDLVHWERLPDALPERPAWQPLAQGLTWAPEVVTQGSGYLMYYVARQQASGLQCITTAASKTPEGPFVDSSPAPFLCQDDMGGSIDPFVLTRPGGERWLYWKNDGNAVGKATVIWAQQLSADGRSLTGPRVDTGLKQTKGWQGPLVEAPTVLEDSGRFFMIYSANGYDTAEYAMGYAVADSPQGPFVDQSDAPWVASAGRAAGPGGQDVVTLADGTRWLAYHAWDAAKVGYGAGGSRAFWVDRLTIEGGRLTLHGPTSQAQPVPLQASG